ncbi:MAG TPA: hypothetical protein VKV95_05010 [Terriglobia bacterium]|nr:hypothetical protein [Terriglobia bacterium]
MKKYTFLLWAAVFCFHSTSHSQGINSLVLRRTIPFPDLQGGFNHMSVDAEHQRLFAAAPTNNTLEIVDLVSAKPWRSLEGERPAAARYAPEFNQLYVPRGQSLYIYDGKTFDLTTKIDLQSSLDELHYDARAKRLYVGCMSSGQAGIAVIAIPGGKLVGKIPLASKPQAFAVELKGSRIFANVPGLNEVAVLHRERLVDLDPWPLDGFQGNTPIELDEEHHRLFVGARQPAQLLVLDTLTGKLVSKVEIDGVADDLFYDPIRRQIYISCGAGFIDVIKQQDSDHYRRTASVPTVAHAATSIFSGPLNALYLGVPRRGDMPAEIRVFSLGN